MLHEQRQKQPFSQGVRQNVASQSGHQDVARRYALALFEMAKEQGKIDQVSHDLVALRGILAQSADFRSLIMNPTIQRDQQVKALAGIAAHAKLSDLTGKFLGTLAAKRRLGALESIVTAAEDQIAHHRGEVTAYVISAQKLEASQIDSIAANLKKTLGMTIKIHATENADIVGGLVIRVGSQLIDSSVRTKLERLTRALKSQSTSTDKTKMKEVA